MYVSGGRTDEPMGMEDTNALVCYHDDTDAWVQCTPMRHNRYYHGMAAVDQVDVTINYTGPHLQRLKNARCMRVIVVPKMFNFVMITVSDFCRQKSPRCYQVFILTEHILSRTLWTM